MVKESVDDIEKVIQYVSHTLSPTQRKWATIKKEAFAVVFSILKLCPYLYGSQFNVYTDHKPLLSMFTNTFNNTKIQRWGVLLAEYGTTLSYRTGRNNTRADMLSRIIQNDHSDIVVFDIDDVDDRDRLTTDDDISGLLPLIHDGLDLHAVALAQHKQFPELWLAADTDDDYDIVNGVLYSVIPPNVHAPSYHRYIPGIYRGIGRPYDVLRKIMYGQECVNTFNNSYVNVPYA